MKSKHFFATIAVAISLFILFPCVLTSGQDDGTALLKSTGIRFQENRGQIADANGNFRTGILYIATAPGARLYFRPDGISYLFTNYTLPLQGEIQEGQRESYRLDMILAGSNPFARVRALDPLPGYVNYYLAHYPGGITGIREYGRIVYENIYHNIDLEILAANGRVKYNFIVRPGGNPADIAMRYEGAIDASVMMDRALSVMTPLGGIEEAAPYTYTSRDLDEVTSRFLCEGNVVRFDIGQYDPSQTLVIDPWATYIGGSAFDMCNAVASDAGGNVFVVGNTQSADFPVSTGAFQSSISGVIDGFIASYDVNGQRLWATYLGGSLRDWAEGIAVDGNGNVIVSGSTDSKDFPVTNGAFQKSLKGKKDAFLAKFTSGGALLWATYYGGKSDENSYPGQYTVVTTDANNDIIFTGSTVSTDFPVTPGAFQSKKGKGPLTDAFLVKFNSSGGRMWATYIGGNKMDAGNAVAADASNNIIVAGLAQSTDFPVTPGCFQPSNGGWYDGFLMKFTSAGNRDWSTYYGGSALDLFYDIGMDSDGSVVATGRTESTNFPVTAGAYQSQNSGDNDAVVVKFSSAGIRAWATYLGGTGGDYGYGIDVDAYGNIIVGGTTSSADFPVVNPLQPAMNGPQDTYLTKMDPTGTSLLWSTFYGGNGGENAYGVAVDNTGSIAMVGTCQADFPTYNPFQPMHGGGSFDGFVVQLNASGQFLKRSVSSQPLPASVVLEPNYPNPFNGSTVIRYTLPGESIVQLRIYDPLGREVEVIDRGTRAAGTYQLEWHGGRGLPTGLYIVQLSVQSGTMRETIYQQKMLVVR